MEIKEMKAAIEAILFASGEPVEVDRIATVLELDKQTVLLLVQEFADRLESNDSGLCLLHLDDKIQLCAKTEYAPYIRRALEIRRNTPLSNAALEVLAVISYNQPVTKSFVEQVRGVDCSGVTGSLISKGLIEERGRLELPGRPLLYGTTTHFLRCFGLSTLADLPPLPESPNTGDSNKEQDGQDGIDDNTV